jgi:hypothetical protein
MSFKSLEIEMDEQSMLYSERTDMIGISENAVLAFCAALSTDIIEVAVCGVPLPIRLLRPPLFMLYVTSSPSARWHVMPTRRA